MAKETENRLLSTAELCRLLEVSRRTVTNWVKQGVPVKRVQPEKGGRPQNMFEASAVEEWLLSENRQAGSTLAKSEPSPPPVERGGRKEAETRTDTDGHGQTRTDAEGDGAAHGYPAGGVGRGGKDLAQILERLQSAERVTYEQWAKAVERNEKRVKKGREPEYSAAVVSRLQENWKNMVEARRKFEKDLPGMMTEHQRYVDIELVCRVWSRLFAATNADLDQIGISCAERCEGRTANEVRVIIDDAVKAAKEHIREGWRKLAGELDRE